MEEQNEQLVREHKKALAQVRDQYEDAASELNKEIKRLKIQEESNASSHLPVAKGIMMKRNSARQGKGSPQPRRVSIKVSDSETEERAGRAHEGTNAVDQEQLEESAGGTGSSGSDRMDQRGSTGSERGSRERIASLEQQLEESVARIQNLEGELAKKVEASKPNDEAVNTEVLKEKVAEIS